MTSPIKAKKEKKLRDKIVKGRQKTLDAHMNPRLSKALDKARKNNIKGFNKPKTTQTTLTNTSETIMEANPDLSDDEVQESPKNQTLQGEVTNIKKGTRQELYPDMDEEDLKYGSMDDVLLEIEVSCDYDGSEIHVFETFRYYEDPSDQSVYGKWIQRWGTPEKGQQVNVDFDNDSNGRVTGLRG